MKFYSLFPVIAIVAVSCGENSKSVVPEKTDPLPSWNDGAVKKGIIDFVGKVTAEGTPDFIPVKDRIACFDNDGTLWSEQPVYFQLAYAMDQVKNMAAGHPEWKRKAPFKYVLEGNPQAALADGESALAQIIMATHAGMTTDVFQSDVSHWIQTARHPKTDKAYNEMVFQPMRELIAFLQESNFTVFIVSGGGVDFMRVWATEAYGIPGHQIIGSSVKVKYELANDGMPQLIKLAQLNFNDDKSGKPVGIWQYIGKRPVFSFGNSDGDYEMLQWTTTASGYPRFGGIIHHTDAEREWAYDRESAMGRLDRGLNDAAKYNWTIVDMKRDWKEIYVENKHSRH